MRVALVAWVVGTVLASPAQAQYLKGNDTGGIIAWSCEAEAAAQSIADAHCAYNNKYARITSVHRQYGDYIAFQCLWNPRQARFAIPAVRTRTVCREHGLRVAY
jgi:hypothetical protein